MSVLDRSALESSPLADLHAIASELGLDGFRRLRKADLIDAIVARQGGEEAPSEAADSGEAEDKPARRPRSRTRSRAKKGSDPLSDGDSDVSGDEGSDPSSGEEGSGEEGSDPSSDDPSSGEDAGERPARPRRSRGGRGRGRGRDRDRDRARDEDRDDREPADDAVEEDRVVEGTVELLGNGSGFVRVAPPEPSDDDVYVSAAQVRRCELVAGDVVAGPVRKPRRSERFPSLIRVDTINGRPADEVAEGTRYDELPASFPTERFDLPGDDPTVQAIAWLTPIGRGSRVTITGGARAGKTEALRRLAGALSQADPGLTVTVVLAGARPEEVPEWDSGPVPPTTTATMAASGDAQAQAVEHSVEQARRLAARGGNAVVLIDSLDGLAPAAARRALAAARNLVDGGSLTVIAVSTRPVGGETTTIALHPALAAARRFPALDLAESGTVRPELLVGEEGVEAIARARAETLGT